jgi:hypothetical protein
MHVKMENINKPESVTLKSGDYFVEGRIILKWKLKTCVLSV